MLILIILNLLLIELIMLKFDENFLQGINNDDDDKVLNLLLDLAEY
jgi:hypothetical protein